MTGLLAYMDLTGNLWSPHYRTNDATHHYIHLLDLCPWAFKPAQVQAREP
jgi:hypothetical protein